MILLLILIHMDHLTTVKTWYEPEVAPSTNSLLHPSITQAGNLLASDVYRINPFARHLVLHLSNNLRLILLLSQKDHLRDLFLNAHNLSVGCFDDNKLDR